MANFLFLPLERLVNIVLNIWPSCLVQPLEYLYHPYLTCFLWRYRYIEVGMPHTV